MRSFGLPAARFMRMRSSNDTTGISIPLERLWAYCAHGGITGHVWERIAPTTLDELAVARHRPAHIAI